MAKTRLARPVSANAYGFEAPVICTVGTRAVMGPHRQRRRGRAPRVQLPKPLQSPTSKRTAAPKARPAKPGSGRGVCLCGRFTRHLAAALQDLRLKSPGGKRRERVAQGLHHHPASSIYRRNISSESEDSIGADWMFGKRWGRSTIRQGFHKAQTG